MSTAPEPRGIRPTWVEIDLAAFENNVAAIASSLPAGSRLIAVLKANAYGHGAVELARRCRRDRVAMIATALLEEALELRRAGIDLPLLVLGPLSEDQIVRAAENDVVLGVPGPEELELAAHVARDRDVRLHLKLDSGMGRMGVVEPELPRVVEILRSAPRLRLEAIYTHYANASDPGDPFTEEQTARFRTLLATLREAGITAPLHHAANSAATVRGLVEAGDFVRVGLALYGAEALEGEGVRRRAAAIQSGGEPPHSRLRPLLTWRTEIARLKELPPGHAIGYGTTFRTTRPSRIATLPVGYADGYDRRHSNRGEVLVRGRRVPVVGRVSMDLVTIDVTGVEGVAVGDEVILLGRQGSEAISVEEIAERTGTISYEVFCSISARVPRFYR